MNHITTSKVLMVIVLSIMSIYGGNISSQQAEKDPLAGVWQGTVHHPKIGDVEFYFTIERKDTKTYFAKMDIPAQKAADIPVNTIRYNAPDLILDISSFGIVFEGRVSIQSSRIEGRLKVGDEVLPLDLHRSEGVPTERRPQDPIKPYPYGEVEVSFPNQKASITLSGTLTLPPGTGPFPAVVLISGSGPHDRNESIAGHRPFLVLADYLTRRGIAVLRYDDRGIMKSQGDFHKATTVDFASDALAAWRFLRLDPRIDRKNIGLIGHSEGALIGAMIAAHNSEVPFLVFLAGTGIPGEQLALRQAQDISRSHGASEEAVQKETLMNEKLFAVFRNQKNVEMAEKAMRAIISDSLEHMNDNEKKDLNISEQSLVQNMRGYLADYPWSRFILSYDPTEDLQKVRCPILVLIGDKDTQVSADINMGVIEKALKKAGNNAYEIKRLPGLNHLFQTAQTGHPLEYKKIEETMAPAVLQLIGDWIHSHIQQGH